MTSAGIYIHIPFCAFKCIYCDFYSLDKREDSIPVFVKSLIHEINQCDIDCSKWKFNTLFIGGGTPSLIAPKFMERILSSLYKKYNLNHLKEVTMEINPGEVSKEYLSDYKSLGINRISIGVQSLEPKLLKFLTRTHTKNDIINTYKNIREVGFENVNCDLIYSIPDQSLDIWKNDLNTIFNLNPEHISAYTLTLEKGTELFSNFSKGLVSMPSHNQDSHWFHMTHEYLSSNGYIPYEVSNFSKKGYKCIHNLHYWEIEPYLAFGPSAHGFDGQYRWNNVRSLNNYIKKLEADQSPISMKEKLTLYDYTNELIGFGMRMVEGLDLQKIPKELQKDYGEKISSVINQYPEYFTKKNNKVAFNKNGLILADQIIPEMILI